MQSSSTFIKISRPITEVKKKSGLINDGKNIFAYWKESKQSESLGNKLDFFQIQLGGLSGGTTPGKFYSFFFHLN